MYSTCETTNTCFKIKQMIEINFKFATKVVYFLKMNE